MQALWGYTGRNRRVRTAGDQFSARWSGTSYQQYPSFSSNQDRDNASLPIQIGCRGWLAEVDGAEFNYENRVQPGAMRVRV
jgi:hypothetical protein